MPTIYYFAKVYFSESSRMRKKKKKNQKKKKNRDLSYVEHENTGVNNLYG